MPRYICLTDPKNHSPSVNKPAGLLPVFQGLGGTTWIEGMTAVLQLILLLTTLIWTVVKIAQAIKDFHGD